MSLSLLLLSYNCCVFLDTELVYSRCALFIVGSIYEFFVLGKSSPQSGSEHFGVCQSLIKMQISFIYGPGHAKMCLMPYANNKGTDQPAHPRSLISAFIFRSLDSIISLVSRSEISRF